MASAGGGLHPGWLDGCLTSAATAEKDERLEDAWKRVVTMSHRLQTLLPAYSLKIIWKAMSPPHVFKVTFKFPITSLNVIYFMT